LQGRYTHGTPLRLASGELDYYYQTSVELEPSAPTLSQTRQAGYGLLNGRLSLALERWNAEVAVYGRNLANIHYNVSAQSVSRAAWASTTSWPRTYGAEFLVHFGGT
jgi:hypothetical protein